MQAPDSAIQIGGALQGLSGNHLSPTLSIFSQYLVSLAFIAGFCGAVWPLINKGSNLGVINSTVAFALVQSAIILPIGLFFTMKNPVSPPMIIGILLATVIGLYCHWQWDHAGNLNRVIIAATFSSVGLIFYTLMLFLGGDKIGLLIATACGVQIVVATVVHIAMNPAQMDLSKLFGLIIIAIGIFVTNK